LHKFTIKSVVLWPFHKPLMNVKNKFRKKDRPPIDSNKYKLKHMTKSQDNCLQVTKHQLEEAFQWVCKQRIHYLSNADIWSFQLYWNEQKTQLLETINSGEYTFLALEKKCKRN
jgi:hypothetical protein